MAWMKLGKPVRAAKILKAYKELPTLAIAEDKHYKVVVKDIRSNLASNPAQHGLVYFIRKSDKQMVWCGCWMDWPEEHWDLCDMCYYYMPRRARAKLEAEEQLLNWVHDEFESLIGRE